MTLQSCDLTLQFSRMNYGITDVHLLRKKKYKVFRMYFQYSAARVLATTMVHAHKVVDMACLALPTPNNLFLTVAK